MNDVKDALRALDRLDLPVSWSEVERRSPSHPVEEPRRSRRIAAVLVALTVATASTGALVVAFRGVHGRTPVAGLGTNGLIVYADQGPQPHSIPFQNIDLFAFDPATGERVNLTNTPTVAEVSPVWSPDGTKVIFDRVTATATGEGHNMKTTEELVVANADLSDQRVIHRCLDSCGIWDIAWSPDDSRLAWTAEEHVQGGYVTALETFDLALGSTTTLCDSRTCGYPGQPVWSPDGTKIAFSDAGIGHLPGAMLPYGPIWIADVETGRVSALTGPSGPCNPGTNSSCVFDSVPEWSPDGRSIAFVRTTRGGLPEATTDLMIVNADGSDPRVLSECASNDQCRQGPVAWSPDGSSIAFVDRYDRPTFHLLDPSSGSDTAISLPAAAGDPLVWSPDGTRLALFGGGRRSVSFFGGGRRSDLFVFDVASGEIRVAKQLSSQGDLAWLPAGTVSLPTVTASGSSSPPVKGLDATYTDPLGWSIDHPSSWYVTPVQLQSRVTVSGAMFSNVPLPTPSFPAPAPTPWTGYPPDLAELSPGAVVLSITHMEGGPAPDLTSDDSSFPLSPDLLRVEHGYTPSTILSFQFRALGVTYEVNAWLGSDVSAADRSVLDRMVASIRVPELTAYTTTGRYFVLDLPDAYPVGTVRLFGPDDFTGQTTWGAYAPFFLVHVEAGFYALGLEDLEGYQLSGFSYDPDKREIVYRDNSGGEARWNLEGQPVNPPLGPVGTRPPLTIHPVIHAWDGHLVTTPVVSFSSVKDALRS